jgi:hypothetical protein
MTDKNNDVIESDEEEAANAEYMQPVWLSESFWADELRSLPSEERRALMWSVRRSGSYVVIPRGLWVYVIWATRWHRSRPK